MTLEGLIDGLCDTSDMTGAEVREELAEQGIDLDAAKARFLPKLDDMMRARAVRLALAAVRDNPLNPDSPLPWRGFGRLVLDRSGNVVCRYIYADRDCTPGIAAAVNAVTILATEVERLTARLAAARAVTKKLWTECRHDCACVNLTGRDCDCGAEIAIELRRAVGLEESHG
jgi:hypothetical protein